MPGDVHPAYTRAALSHLWAFPVVVSAAQRRFMSSSYGLHLDSGSAECTQCLGAGGEAGHCRLKPRISPFSRAAKMPSSPRMGLAAPG